ncbi:MAG: hypothetical protein NT062_29050, partial [Proteobacteria bacterium]|nr:hypothetical protein [Pseudomonadota bacterium]
MHPVPSSADVLAILDRIIRRIARRLADKATSRPMCSHRSRPKPPPRGGHRWTAHDPCAAPSDCAHGPRASHSTPVS